MDASPPEEDIAAWQSGWHVPEDVLEDVVRQATGSGVARDERILEGHENEVHAVATADEQRVIVRIGWRPGPAFERERWPMKAARRAGIPVPDILLIEHTVLDDQEVSFNVQEWMPGSPIHHLRRNLDGEGLAGLTRDAGRLLATLHTIEPSGRGPLDASGAVDQTLGIVGSRI